MRKPVRDADALQIGIAVGSSGQISGAIDQGIGRIGCVGRSQACELATITKIIVGSDVARGTHSA